MARWTEERERWTERRDPYRDERIRPATRRLLGKGPKGYRRPDPRIRDEVAERIARSGIAVDDVEVQVENGEVTLSGSVASREEKRRLEGLADDVFGVREVHDALRVRREGQPSSGAAIPAGTGTTGTGVAMSARQQTAAHGQEPGKSARR